MSISSVTPYVFFPLLGVILADLLRHVILAWAVAFRVDRTFARHRSRSSRSRPWLAQSLVLPYPAAPADDAARYRRHMTRFVYDWLAFVVVGLVGFFLVS
jgi:hypothetical protein